MAKPPKLIEPINGRFEDVFKNECSGNDDYLVAWYDGQEWDSFDDVEHVMKYIREIRTTFFPNGYKVIFGCDYQEE